eukprot:gnl/MRDRNA2_/MRDRNA2_142067_c0_seq1.p1 gnl/MRDRNA2_/MRDRNA2_142067_c0~~gnl/MRDRNA2_/MRDRNA2_142067_c0_seq1.p1  ORF type:complete len:160 (+),score=44.79 gnl/MRDRNA2_/MRDRNA2_142067_c0_seq1:160-639(+)
MIFFTTFVVLIVLCRGKDSFEDISDDLDDLESAARMAKEFGITGGHEMKLLESMEAFETLSSLGTKFEKVDGDKSGHIDMDELKILFQNMKASIGKMEKFPSIKKHMKMIPGSDSIEEMEKAFAKLDKDGNGKINKKEFRIVAIHSKRRLETNLKLLER